MSTTTRRYVTESEIRAAKQMDLLTYLQIYEPYELIKEGAGYRTRTHDSLKISNGMWHWFSRGIGGKTALDYLIHVKGMDFVPAVQTLNGVRANLARTYEPEPVKPKPFQLPPKYPDCARVIQYLKHRGISIPVLHRCIDEGILYESDRYHNAVFVGKDGEGFPRYAMQRSTGVRTLKMEIEGSNKRFCFSLQGTSDTLIVAESVIDALSLATMIQQSGKHWREYHYLSLGGVSVKKQSDVLPIALKQYLSDHPQIQRIRLALDNDEAGRKAANHIADALNDQYEVAMSFPKKGKDFNDQLQSMRRTNIER